MRTVLICAALVLFPATPSAQNYICTKRDIQGGVFELYCSGIQPTTPTQPVMPPITPPRGDLVLNRPGSIQRVKLQPGVTYTAPLPSASGTFQYAATTGTPGWKSEVSISRIPGDFAGAQRVLVTGGTRGGVSTPCYQSAGHEGVIRWGGRDFHVCPVVAGETQYLNIRVTESADIDFYTSF